METQEPSDFVQEVIGLQQLCSEQVAFLKLLGLRPVSVPSYKDMLIPITTNTSEKSECPSYCKNSSFNLFRNSLGDAGTLKVDLTKSKYQKRILQASGAIREYWRSIWGVSGSIA